MFCFAPKEPGSPRFAVDLEVKDLLKGFFQVTQHKELEKEREFPTGEVTRSEETGPRRLSHLRIGNGVGKQGYSNRPPIDDRNPIRKFSIDCLDASKTND